MPALSALPQERKVALPALPALLQVLLAPPRMLELKAAPLMRLRPRLQPLLPQAALAELLASSVLQVTLSVRAQSVR